VDWRILVSTFGAIFLAEIGDKTQLATITLAASTGRPLAVFAGAALALATVSGLGVVLGGGFSAYLPLMWIKRAAACIFVTIGLLMLFDRL